jgi:hypothetical protein
MILNSKRNYLKVEDVKAGDVVEINSEGEWTESTKYKYEDGTPRKQFAIEVIYAKEPRTLTLNSTNRSNLTNVWGNDTANWVGKKASVEIIKVSVAGKLMNSILLNPIKEVTEPEVE